MLKQQNFFDRNIPAWKQVLFLSWPTIVELLLQTAVNYVDTAMVGSIGVNATAAVSITMSTIWLINGFMNAVGIGYSVLAAHSIGEGNYEQAKVIIRQSILAIGVAGIFLTLIVTLFIAPNLPAWMHAEKEVVPLARSYLRIIGMGYLFNISLIVCSNLLRCAGDTKTPMKFMYGDNVFEKDGIRRDRTGDGEKTRCLCGKRGIFNRDGPAMGPQIIRQLERRASRRSASFFHALASPGRPRNGGGASGAYQPAEGRKTLIQGRFRAQEGPLGPSRKSQQQTKRTGFAALEDSIADEAPEGKRAKRANRALNRAGINSRGQKQGFGGADRRGGRVTSR